MDCELDANFSELLRAAAVHFKQNVPAEGILRR